MSDDVILSFVAEFYMCMQNDSEYCDKLKSMIDFIELNNFY